MGTLVNKRRAVSILRSEVHFHAVGIKRRVPVLIPRGWFHFLRMSRLLVTSGALVLCPQALRAQRQQLALTHATVIDGTGAAPRDGQTIVLREGRITEIFPDGTKPLPAGQVLDLTGKFVIPGLIDAHVHLATDPSGRDANAVQQLRGALLGGVTSVRDMAGDAVVLRQLAANAQQEGVASPRIFYSAVFAGPTFFEDPRTRSAAHGGVPGQVPWMRAVSDTTDVPAAVTAARGTGATGIKLYADLPPTLVARITSEAHKQGLKVWSHATIYPSRPSDAISAGVDVISHAILLYWQGAAQIPARYHARSSSSVYDSMPADGAVMTNLYHLMRDKGTVLDATLFISSRLEGAPPGTAGIADPHRATEWMYAVTSEAKKSGVPVAAGTDGMMPGNPAELPNLHREMELLVTRAGFTPLEAITSATLNSARALGIESSAGSIAPGKYADLVILGANPLTDIRNTRSVERVIKDGHLFEIDVATRP
jgi:imidazolonepropionase-like amidohydrolase